MTHDFLTRKPLQITRIQIQVRLPLRETYFCMVLNIIVQSQYQALQSLFSRLAKAVKYHPVIAYLNAIWIKVARMFNLQPYLNISFTIYSNPKPCLGKTPFYNGKTGKKREWLHASNQACLYSSVDQELGQGRFYYQTDRWKPF